jgi:hypothetical protein
MLVLGAYLALAGAVAAILLYVIWDQIRYSSTPTLDVPVTAGRWPLHKHTKQPSALTACCNAEDLDGPASKQQYVPGKDTKKSGIPCYDPSTMQLLGYAKAMTPQEVNAFLHTGKLSAPRRTAQLNTNPSPCPGASLDRAGQGGSKGACSTRLCSTAATTMQQSMPLDHCVLLSMQVWRTSSFKQRRLLLQVLLKYIITHQEDISK